MIINGAARSNGTQLGNYLVHNHAENLGLGGYLSNQGENEQIRVLELYGVSVNDVVQACIQMDRFRPRHSRPDRKSLYHMQINPEARYELSDEDWLHAADVAGEEMDLDGQPRVIVLHTKKGRTHAHVVFQRTHIKTLKLVSDSWDYISHERAARRLEEELGHQVVPGVHVGPQRKARSESKTYPCHEAKQEKPGALTREQRKAEITALFQQSDGRSAFIAALQDHGYTLARGDRRAFVVVDIRGKVHSLARQIEGVNTPDLRQFMGPLLPEHLPSVEEVRLKLSAHPAQTLTDTAIQRAHRQRSQTLFSSLLWIILKELSRC